MVWSTGYVSFSQLLILSKVFKASSLLNPVFCNSLIRVVISSDWPVKIKGKSTTLQVALDNSNKSEAQLAEVPDKQHKVLIIYKLDSGTTS